MGKRSDFGALRRLPHWLVLLATGFPLYASPIEDFQTANKLYDEGKFADATALYEKIEPKTAHVYFNMGNALYLAGERGRSVLSYERARRISPRDPEILANLRFAQERLGVDAVNTRPGAVTRFVETIAFRRTVNEWSVQELAAVWCTVILLALALWLPRARHALLWAAAVSFVWVAVSFAALSYRIVQHRSSPAAVVLARLAEARFAPLADSTVHFKLVEGTKLAIKEDRGQWLLVERADGQQGWVKKEAVEPVWGS